MRQKKRISKTERILGIYQIFQFYEEVSMQELRNNFRDYCDKTFLRDIALLKQAGVPIRFSARRKAFVLVNESGEESPRTSYRDTPEFPSGAKEKQFIEKIIRFITLMNDIPDAYCDIWYRETFPGISKRTMQRDFYMLGRLGFRIRYARVQDDCPHCWDDDVIFSPHYYCEPPLY